MLSQRGLNFSQFNAEAANFHLVVKPTEKLNIAIAVVAGIVASFIQTPAWLVAKGVGDEPKGGQFRTVEVVPRQTVTTDIQLPRDTDRHWLR